MDCRAVRAHLLVPSAGAVSAAATDHLAGCSDCGRLAAALLRLDAAVRPALVADAPPSLQERLALRVVSAEGAAASATVAAARVDAAMRAALLTQPPADLQARLAALAQEFASEQSPAASRVAPATAAQVPPHMEPPSTSAAEAGARTEAAARVEAAMRSALVAQPPAGVQARLETLVEAQVAGREEAAARVEAAMRSALVVPPPAGVQARLETLVEAQVAGREEAAARVEAAMRSALVLQAPVQVRQRLAALAPPMADRRHWFAAARRGLRERPGVLAGQVAAVAVLAYVVLQLFSWLGTLPVVVGDVPYALELLVFSPAVDYLGQIESLVQQLALWLMVGAAGFILVRGFSPRSPNPEA